jgi:hypothetical protein
VYSDIYTEHINHLLILKAVVLALNMMIHRLTLFLQLGLFAHPIYSISGDYPPEVRARVDSNSRAEGYYKSRLPYFTQEEVDYIRGQRNGYKSLQFGDLRSCCINPYSKKCVEGF